MFHWLIIFIFLSAIPCIGQQAATKSKTKPWPTVLKGRGVAKVVLTKNQISGKERFVYLCRQFKFISDKKLDSTKIARFAATAESVPAAVGRIPLDLKRLPNLEDGKKRHPIYIASSVEEFVKLGGSENSAGYYSGRMRAVVLRADKFLDVKRPDYRLLAHELVHLSMHGINGKCNAWFSEGNAEYFASAFYGTSSYKFSAMSQSIKDRTKRFFKRGEPVKLHPLDTFVTRDSNEWRKINSDLAPEDRYSQYMTALLVVHYFYHIDPQGKSKIAKYLALMQDGRKDDADQAHLFPVAELPKIQNSIIKFWKPKGYQIEFEEY